MKRFILFEAYGHGVWKGDLSHNFPSSSTLTKTVKFFQRNEPTEVAGPMIGSLFFETGSGTGMNMSLRLVIRLLGQPIIEPVATITEWRHRCRSVFPAADGRVVQSPCGRVTMRDRNSSDRRLSTMRGEPRVRSDPPVVSHLRLATAASRRSRSDWGASSYGI